MTAPPTHAPGSKVLVAVVAGILVAVLAIVLLGGDDVVEYDPGTPEAAAQAYLQALFEGDGDAAHALLSPRHQARCEPYELDLHGEDFTSATFTETRIADGRATIDVRMSGSEFIPDPVVIGSHELHTEIVLESLDGEWRIVAADWPLDSCLWR
jgi:hypothetical protein